MRILLLVVMLFVKIPAGVARVTVRARHKPKGYDGETMRVALPR